MPYIEWPIILRVSSSALLSICIGYAIGYHRGYCERKEQANAVFPQAEREGPEEQE